MNIPNTLTIIFVAVYAAFSSIVSAEEAATPVWNAALVKVGSDAEVDELLSEGANILRRRGDILLCLIPDSLADITGSDSDFPRKVTKKNEGKIPRFKNKALPTLDKAAEYFGASRIHSGEGLDRPYTGRGTVVGICDIGFDPLHPTFLDATGRSRVKRLTQYIEHENIRIEIEGDEEYMAWRTDDVDNYHATHVCGILAGRGDGSPYVGIATDADIVVSTSTLTDVGLLAGVEDIIDYAKEVGKPCVVNLSMGSYTGAHDGTSLFSQYLDLCASDAIIVLSAGNEGDQTNCLHYEFSAEKPSVQFRLGSRDWKQQHIEGMTDIWSGDDSPLTIGIGIYDSKTRKIVADYGPISLSDYESVTYRWTPAAESDEDTADAWSIDGYLSVYGGVNPENGRYQAALVYEYESPILLENATWARYVVCVTVDGQEGKDVDIYSDGARTRLMKMDGSPAPDSSMSFSDLACGHRVISVGMYGNRAESPMSDFSVSPAGVWEKPSGYQAGEIAVHSSYATLRDGRVMPLTVAPGAPLMSAGSRPFLEQHPEKDHLLLDSPWISECGTSMSSPYVAGYIATFLEAKPDLTVEDIMLLISRTNATDLPDPDNPRHGCGWFDPYAVLWQIIADEGGVHLPSDPSGILAPDDEVSLYSIDGRILYSGPYSSLPDLGDGMKILHTPYGPVKMRR